MSRINLWSRTLSRIEVEERSRDARLRLEQLERLLASRVGVRRYRRRRLLSFGVGRCTHAVSEHRVGRPLSDQQPSRMPAISFDGSYIAAFTSASGSPLSKMYL
jgi:hypothetical protein